MTLASPGTRILAVLIDGAMFLGFVMVGGIISAVLGAIVMPANPEDVTPTTILLANSPTIVAFLIAHIINIYFISQSGQSVGKMAMGIRMVNSQTGVTASFSDGWFSRVVVFGFLTGIPVIGGFVAIADIVFLFLDGHETIHDKVAKTMVVQNKR